MTHTEQYLSETAEIASKIDASKVEEMVKELVSLRTRGGRLFVLGLGGSAANASHAVNDFRKLCGIEAYAPTDNVAELTARANDEGWHRIFIDWMLASHITKNDSIFVLSVGGGTFNVSIPITGAVGYFSDFAVPILAIVGKDHGATQDKAQKYVIVPTVESSRVTPHTEGWQSVILHCIVSHPDLQRNPTKW